MKPITKPTSCLQPISRGKDTLAASNTWLVKAISGAQPPNYVDPLAMSQQHHSCDTPFERDRTALTEY